MYIHTMMGDMGWIDESVGCLGYYCMYMMGVLKMYMYNNNNNCLKSNIQCIEIRVQWTVHNR